MIYKNKTWVTVVYLQSRNKIIYPIVNTAKFNKELIDVQDELKKVAYRLTANKDKAEDLLQETLLKVIDNKEKYKEDTNFKGWAYTIMRNIFINDYRKEVHETSIVDYENKASITGHDCCFTSTNTENYIYNKEIYSIVNELTKYYRQPFLLYISGFKYHEIANRLQIPIGTVKSRIYSTRQLLKKKLIDFRS